MMRVFLTLPAPRQELGRRRLLGAKVKPLA
jgi:hypothetical protein